MKLVFLGTRANIDAANRRHRRHAALLAGYRGRRVMIDCGADWRGRIGEAAPHAIFLTHAHPDHAWGLADGAPCPVYAAAETWAGIADFPIAQRIEVAPRAPVAFAENFTFEAFPVVHSLRAPAVGYRVTAGRRAIFYVPDVVDVIDRDAALSGVDLFVGDGSSLTRPLVRRRGEALFGHTRLCSATPRSAPSSAGARRPASPAPCSPIAEPRSSRATSASSPPSCARWGARAASRPASPATAWRWSCAEAGPALSAMSDDVSPGSGELG
jgi:hypothetical protein